MQIPQVGLARRLRGPVPSEYAEVEPPTRFQAGVLKPVQEATGRASRKERSGLMRLFDRALLVAEVASALVVTWLVAQYVYTVYFDTAPRRVTPAISPAAPAPTRSVGAAPERIATVTPTRIAEVAPPLQGPPPAGPEGAQPGRPEPTATEPSSSTPTPTIDPQLLLPMRLRIPAMFLDSPVHEVTVNMGVWQVSPMDIGHHEGTAGPGQAGNMVLAGHRDINSALFRELDRLKPGDEVFVSNSLAEYRYIVTESFVVSPDHIEVMDPTDDRRVTLITCTPIGLATQRLIVTAILDE
jgi:LPXTG-site transpeptidase (sortase) family protein